MRAFKFIAFSRLTIMDTNGMKLCAARGFCGGGQGQGRRWRQQQFAYDTPAAMEGNKECRNGFNCSGQGHGRCFGCGQGGGWRQEQAAYDAAVTMEGNGGGHEGLNCGGRGRGYGRGQGRGWRQQQQTVSDTTMTMEGNGGLNSLNCNGQGEGRGYARGQGGRQQQVAGVSARGRGCNQEDRATIQNLVDHREHIQRTVEKTGNGIKTHTWSADEQVSDWIIEHVNSMKKRMEEGNRIRQRDPLFVAAFDHAHLIDKFVVEELDNGVKVTETSADACTVDILHAHSEVVSGFIDHGRYEMRRNHPVPGSCRGEERASP